MSIKDIFIVWEAKRKLNKHIRKEKTKMRLKNRVETLNDKVENLERINDNMLDYINKYFDEEGNEFVRPFNWDYLFGNENSTTAQTYYFINDVKNRFKSNQKQIEALEERVNKQEETIKALLELCRPMITERLSTALGEINDLLEKELKDLFGSETANKTKKETKASAKNTEKVDEPKKATKTEKKSKKKGEK